MGLTQHSGLPNDTPHVDDAAFQELIKTIMLFKSPEAQHTAPASSPYNTTASLFRQSSAQPTSPGDEHDEPAAKRQKYNPDDDADPTP